MIYTGRGGNVLILTNNYVNLPFDEQLRAIVRDLLLHPAKNSDINLAYTRVNYIP